MHWQTKFMDWALNISKMFIVSKLIYMLREISVKAQYRFLLLLKGQDYSKIYGNIHRN